MNASFLQKIGLTPEDEEATTASFEPASSIINPVSRQLINRVSFSVVDDRLVVIEPASLVGTTPIALSRVERASDLEDQLNAALNEVIIAVQRRSSDFQALGIPVRVDPETLLLSAEVDSPPYKFVLVSDKRGQMRVASASRGDAPVQVPDASSFDAAEFRERGALTAYLHALLGDKQDAMEVTIGEDDAPAAPKQLHKGVTFGDLVDCFGRGAQLPATTMLETLVEMKVGEEKLRFAAARVTGRTFRGLLAGSKGKIWADRFELDEFPGVVALVAEHMKVPMDEVQVIGPPGEETT